MSSRNRARARKRNEARRKKNLDRALALISEAEEKDEKPKLERARYMTQLEYLLSRQSITDAQYEAGDKLYRAWRASGAEPTIVSSYDEPVISVGDFTERAAAARQEVRRALQYLGVVLSPIIVHVCLLDGSLPEWERQANRKAGDGASLLRLGLDGLCSFYATHRRATRLSIVA